VFGTGAKRTIYWFCLMSDSSILGVLGARGHDKSRRQLDEFIEVAHVGYKFSQLSLLIE
jgi:hypothetical protein